MTLNRYTYVNGNPVMGIDPLGRSTLTSVVGFVGLGLAAATIPISAPSLAIVASTVSITSLVLTEMDYQDEHNGNWGITSGDGSYYLQQTFNLVGALPIIGALGKGIGEAASITKLGRNSKKIWDLGTSKMITRLGIIDNVLLLGSVYK